MEIIPVAKKNLNKNAIEVVDKIKSEFKMVGKQRVVAGHILFSFNCKTGEIKQAEIQEKAEINLKGEVVKTKKVVIDKDCFYDQALNRKNFIKRLKRARSSNQNKI